MRLAWAAWSNAVFIGSIDQFLYVPREVVNAFFEVDSLVTDITVVAAVLVETAMVAVAAVTWSFLEILGWGAT